MPVLDVEQIHHGGVLCSILTCVNAAWDVKRLHRDQRTILCYSLLVHSLLEASRKGSEFVCLTAHMSL